MKTNTPATDIVLKNRALIEASAGTGKTWTLTGILLRLLLEENIEDGISPYAPKSIIATTFTRKAAAEMKLRIQKKLIEFRELLRGIILAYESGAIDFNDDAQLWQRIEDLFIDWQASDPEQAEIAHDKINHHILKACVNSQGLDGFIRLFKRTELRLSDYGEMFVGTLDSLCQKWLNEYALETKTAKNLELVENPVDLIHEIAHDLLRQLFVAHRRQNKVTFDAVFEEIQSSEAYANAILSVFNYQNIEIAAVNKIDYSYEKHEEIMKEMGDQKHIDYLAELSDVNSEFVKNINGRAALAKGLKAKDFSLVTLWMELRNNEIQHQTAIDYWRKLIMGEKPFNKGFDPAAVLNSDTICLLKEKLAMDERYHQYKKSIIAEISKEVLAGVRSQFSKQLEKQNLTTFSQQMLRLMTTLSFGKSGNLMAADISERYPVMLVDESQDLNDGQSFLLEKIYLSSNTNADFLMLVGDPKQAIYQFRGGDVANYVRLKEYFSDAQRYDLLSNYRSDANVIAGINDLFDGINMGDGITFKASESPEDRAQSDITNIGQKSVAKPIHWYETQSKDEYKKIIKIIKAITSPNSIYGRDNQAIQYRDIMVLFPSHKKLIGLQNEMNQQAVPSEYLAQSSIFSGDIARGIDIFLSTMLNPERKELINQLLMSCFFNLSLSEIEAVHLAEHELSLVLLNQVLRECAESWEKGQLLFALQKFLSTSFYQQTIWEQLAAYESVYSERYLLDLRKFQQIIADKKNLTRPQSFYRWWQQQMEQEPTEDWAITPALPSKNAVRLMTFHKSKGLQAPVVIVGSSILRKETISIYNTYREGDKVISSADSNDKNIGEILQKIEMEERARLLYVAMTRGESLLFFGCRPPPKKGKEQDILRKIADKGMQSKYHQFLPNDAEEIYVALASDKVQWQEENENKDYILPSNVDEARCKFEGWQRTSFTSLSRKVVSETLESVPDYIAEEKENSEIESGANDLMCFNFPKGANAGSFLHKVLEKMGSNSHNWADIIQKQAWRYQIKPLDERYSAVEMKGLLQWFENIYQSPLISGTNLANIPGSSRCNEMSFLLSVKQYEHLKIKELNRLFEKWGKPIVLGTRQPIYGFLKGEIDLCYEYQGKFHILDYKSNYLGGSYQNYTNESMHDAMDEHYYWLQALIYQVALHRFLSLKLPDYDVETHLGNVEYYFIRGAQQQEKTGHLSISIDTSMLLEFDEIIGGKS